MTMKMYVWEGVLCDWTCGMVVVLAETKEQALKTAEEQLEHYEYDEIKDMEPDVYEVPKAVCSHGGG